MKWRYHEATESSPVDRTLPTLPRYVSLPVSSVVTYRPARLFTAVFGSDSPTITFTTDYHHHDGGSEKLYGSGAKAGRKYLIYFTSIFNLQSC